MPYDSPDPHAPGIRSRACSVYQYPLLVMNSRHRRGARGSS